MNLFYEVDDNLILVNTTTTTAAASLVPRVQPQVNKKSQSALKIKQTKRKRDILTDSSDASISSSSSVSSLQSPTAVSIYDALTNEYKDLLNSLTLHISSETSKSKRTIHDLTSSNNDNILLISELREEIKQQTDVISTLINDKTILKNSQDLMKAHLSGFEKKIGKMAENIEVLENSNSKWSDLHDEKQSQQLALQNRINELTTVNAQLQNRNRVLQERFENKAKKMRELLEEEANEREYSVE